MLEGKKAKEFLKALNSQFDRQQKKRDRRIAVILFFVTLILGELIIFVLSRFAG